MNTVALSIWQFNDTMLFTYVWYLGGIRGYKKSLGGKKNPFLGSFAGAHHSALA